MSETIREFLVKIGYEEQGRRDFTAGLRDVTGQCAELGIRIQETAAKVKDAIASIASNLEVLYFQSQRTGATIEGIKAIGFAAEQTGSSVEAARGSLENFGRFLRTIPNARAILQGLGVDTVGKTADQMMPDLLRHLNTMQPAVAMAWANLFGIDERTLLAAADKTNAEMEARYKQMARAAKINFKQAAEDSHFFMVALRSLGAAFGLLGEKIGAAFSRPAGDLIEQFRAWLVQNFDRIADAIQWFTKGLADTGDILLQWLRGLRGIIRDVGDVWRQLDDDSQTFLLAMATIAGGLFLLDQVMKMSLVGRIFAVGLALAALWIDYKQWKEGKDSPIPWADWEPVLTAAGNAIVTTYKALKSLTLVLWSELKPWFDSHKGAFSDLFDPKAIKKNIDEITAAVSWIPKTLEGYVKFWGGLARGDFGMALEGLQLIKDQTFGEGAPPFMRTLDQQVTDSRESPSLLNRGLRWVGRQFGNTNDQAHPEAASAIPKDNAAKMALAQESYNFWKTRGFTDEGAATMVAAEQRESQFNIAARGDPNALGQMTAHGSFQWHGDRRAAIKEKVGIDVSTATHAQQLEAAAREAELGLDPQWAAAYQKAKTARDTVVAADAVVNGMLRPADRQGAQSHDAVTARAWLPLLAPGAGNVTPIVPRTTAEVERARGLPPGTLPREQQPQPQPLPPLLPDQRQRLFEDFEKHLQERRITPITPEPVLPTPLGGPTSSVNDNSRSVAMNQTNHITVQSGEGDGWEIGRSVLEAQRTLAAATVRDMRSRVA